MNRQEKTEKTVPQLFKNFQTIDETSYCVFYKHEHMKIFMVEYKMDAEIGLEEAKEIIAKIKEISNGIRPLFGITALSKGAYANADARAYFATDRFSQEETSGMAVIIKQLSQRLLYRIYLKFNKPKSPIKAFNSVEEAVIWLDSLGA